jgi:hypothetical protein
LSSSEEAQALHLGPDADAQPMKATFYAYVVDSWIGYVLESELGVVSFVSIEPMCAPLPFPGES